MKRVYVVRAECNGVVQYWGAATPLENATRAVLQHVDEDWDVRLTDHVLSGEKAASLDISEGHVRRIRYPKNLGLED